MRRATHFVGWIGLAACAAGVRADTIRNFEMTADQVVPASASLAAGHGRATLDTGETQIEFVVEHGVNGASLGSATVRNADWGSNGPVVFTLDFVNSNAFAGTWSVIAGDVAQFQAGRLYVQIDTPEFPGGAIRGQIDLNPAPAPGDVIISEIMYDPNSYEGAAPTFISNPEWIELFNTTYTDIDIGGWFFQDEDANEAVDPCEPMRGGTFPNFVLPSFGLVVIIPDGLLQLGNKPTVADFKTAWGLNATHNVIQVNTNGTAGGAIVGRNLSNNPINDTFDVNDLPLDASFWIPCDPEGFERPDNEVLTLNDGTQIIDVVNYDDGFPFTSVWPDVGKFNSITIVPDDYPSATSFDAYTALGNDNGANWIAHQIGDDALGFEQVAAVGVYDGSDVGSPCRLLGATIGNLPPASVSAQVLTSPGETEEIFLEGTDRTRPFFGLLLFIIKSLPQNGQLIDVASNKVITQSMVGANGYLMPRIPFNHVRYINNGNCGLDSFMFTTNDGLLESQPVSVELFVQCGDVVITEIMYNPDSAEIDVNTNAPTPALPEWVELYNVSSKPIDLAGWYLADNYTRGGDLPPYILGAGSAVAVIPAALDPAEFTTGWDAPFVHTTTNGETGLGGAVAGSNLNNSGESLRLVAPGGSIPQVHDAVFFYSGFEDPAWPALSPDGPSIYVLPAAGYTAAANDDPAAWAESFIGLDGAYSVTFTPVFDGFDIGSPGHLSGVIQGSCSSTSPLFDGNGDGGIMLDDFEHFLLCYNGPQQSMPNNCDCFDADTDADVDLRDGSHVMENMYSVVPEASDLLISEVLDGTLTNGEPKLIEITNCGDLSFNLSEFRIAIYSNGGSAEHSASMGYGNMSGTLAAGASFVIANTAAGPGLSYLAVYGEEADLYDAVANANGNDVYELFKNDGFGGDILIDAFGVRGVDGTGTAWEYLDGGAESLPGRTPNSGIFNPANWSFSGPNAYDGFTPAQLNAATSAGTHTCD